MAYLARTTFSGYKVGLANPSLYVGIPAQYWHDGKVMVSHGGEIRELHEKDVETEKEFDHKHKSGTYKLRYVMWKEVQDNG